MLIPVTLLSSSGSSSNAKLPSGLAQISHAEVVLIELQGSLEVDSAHPQDRNGKFVGTLALDTASNKPTLRIGNHLLEGKIAALPKPYAVLVRNAPRAGTARSKLAPNITEAEADEMGADPDAMEVDGDAEFSADADADAGSTTPDAEASAGWTIRGIVKKKIIFSKRPMPVIGKKPQ